MVAASIPWTGGMVLAIAVSVLGVRLLAGSIVGPTLRRRFVLGVPWGTVVVVGLVLSVYLFVQGGINDLRRPARFPFSAWSYFYPLGMVASSFSHASLGHLTNNMIGTLVLAPLAEYVYGHYPRDRGSSSFGSLRANPYVRAFVIFPGAVVVIGLLTSIASWGPVIGFSGVVFAFAGFALVRYPLLTVVALTARGVVRTIYEALMNPTVTQGVSESISTPSWAGISVQGHALGLFIGVILGALLCWRRSDRPDPRRLWAGTVLAGFTLSLWAVWWFADASSYTLFRALGVMLVFLLALLIAAGVSASDRDLFDRGPLSGYSRRQIGLALLTVPVLVMFGVALVTNLAVVDGTGLPDDTEAVTVEDYVVTYAEDVDNRMLFVAEDLLGAEAGNTTASGVIVVSEKRHIWMQHTSADELALRGQDTVVVGGVGWQERVHIHREGWRPVGDDTAYRVVLGTDRDDMQTAHVSDPQTADLRVENHTVTVIPERDGFSLAVDRHNESATVPLPNENETVRALDLDLTRDDDRIIAETNGTEVTVAERE